MNDLLSGDPVTSDPQSGDSPGAADRYESQLRSADAQLAQLQRRDERLSRWRTATFAAGLVGIGLALATGQPFWYVVAVAAAVAFVLLVGAHESATATVDAVRRRAAVLRRLLARLNRDWPSLDRVTDAMSLEQPGDVADWFKNPAARDLDLTGTASLLRLVSVAGTAGGHQRLAQWLLAPAIADRATDRHAAASELAGRRDERLEFYVQCAAVGRDGGLRSLADWCASPDWITPRGGWIAWGYVSAVIGLTGLLVAAAASVDLAPADWRSVAIVTVLGLGIVNLILAAGGLSPVTVAIQGAIGSVGRVVAIEKLIDAGHWFDDSDSPMGRRIAATLVGPDAGAARGAIQRLRPIAVAAGLKQNALTFFPYLVLQSLGLWDAHVLRRLERWKVRHGSAAERWIESLQELEALASIAALIDDYPLWASPRWLTDDQTPRVDSAQLGHPLLPDDVRVCNDVSLGPPGRLLLVTGSNMSGKSTMLRAIGTNVALAGAGGRVCAQSLTLPSVRLATCIRVTDDLASGVSFYMAELRRLAEVVADAAGDKPTTQLFLLDEILQGTNSAERQIAVARVLEHLTAAGSFGAVSTHDLELAGGGLIGPIADVVHFRETIDPTKQGLAAMTFDHVMHPGVCPTTNALRLLEIVGLRGRA